MKEVCLLFESLNQMWRQKFLRDQAIGTPWRSPCWSQNQNMILHLPIPYSRWYCVLSLNLKIILQSLQALCFDDWIPSLFSYQPMIFFWCDQWDWLMNSFATWSQGQPLPLMIYFPFLSNLKTSQFRQTSHRKKCQNQSHLRSPWMTYFLRYLSPLA